MTAYDSPIRLANGSKVSGRFSRVFPTTSSFAPKISFTPSHNPAFSFSQLDSGSSGEVNSSLVEDSLDLMNQCDVYDGSWVRDESYPLYGAGSCPFIDEQFNCFLNGRPDNNYQKLRWQPNACDIPRNENDCFLNRCNKNYMFDYDCSVEFFRSPFLVQEWEMLYVNGSKRSTLRLDLLERSSGRYRSADVLIFNTGHWWTRGRTAKGKGYFQEGNHIYAKLNVMEAFRKAMMTWARWIDANVDPAKTIVFFSGYSPAHFRGGQWNSGGQCDRDTEPIKNAIYLSDYPQKMRVLEDVMKGMRTPVLYLNVTRMADYRKDAHPSIYRKQKLTEEKRQSTLQFQDCSHWCLPGVPDTWNELLYFQLLKYYKQQL
ncbi:unnamed protein product [Thlaspi arvense]|uniref:Trichome birefringence-like N-terminal domain-containing protein n=1 Tax=Thlaspi arvense TaxID=13288 RepID=A0AAU9RKZ5_THLAR|nr:unnamed protein product [Thlaspi arvense]